MNRKNPFEILRKPGVCGTVATSGYKTSTVFSHGSSQALQIRTAELISGVWGFGFLLIIDNLKREMFPGEGSGWFLSEEDAVLYALAHIRHCGPHLPKDMKFAVDVAISKLRNKSLFDD